MAENLDVPRRFAVRTPMQWTAADNGGFTTAQKRRLTRPFPAVSMARTARRSWPTCAGRNPGGRWSRCTTSERTAASFRFS
jgi:hypothetical protein